MDTKKQIHKIAPRVFLPKELLEKCSRCGKYLSVGPIKLEKNKPVCGRCFQIEGNPLPAYENLAQFMVFPCVNDVHGCDATLAWGSVASHEKSCQFSPLECPALTCEKKIESKEIIEHFQEEHQDLLITGNQFNIPCSYGGVNEYVNMLALWKKKPLIVKINYSNNCCFCNILTLSKAEQLKYSLFLEDNKKQQSLQIKNIPLSQYRIKHHDNLTMTKIDVIVVKKVLNSENVICTFNISTESQNDTPLNTNLLLELECPICTNYMIPPIFMCAIGHSLCGNCKQNISMCPSCRIELKDNRNFSLEKVTDHVLFPCKLREYGCFFVGKIKELNAHELICQALDTTETECYIKYLSPCNWKGRHSEVISHITKMHSKYFFDINDFIYFDLSIFEKLNVFAGNGGNCFKLCVIFTTNSFKFCVKLIQNKLRNYEQFRYFIDFTDLNGYGRVLLLDGDCIPSSANDDNMNDCLNIPYSLVKPFVRLNNLQFKINIMTIYHSDLYI
ncbi:uncharacterized protein isoform X2 [Leptinotarsa decemlineata]|uniref:uncharacterized protein isoform X2 n=1 Tax=Leptinotarsa decemlineata TaxID=7539 RepID=UPI003D30C7BE